MRYFTVLRFEDISRAGIVHIDAKDDKSHSKEDAKLWGEDMCAREPEWVEIKAAIVEFTMDNYTEEELSRAYPEFPYSSIGLSDELAFRDFVDWFILERIQPSTGKTIVREFTEKSSLSLEVREKIAQMENVIFGEYEILDIVEKTETCELCLTLRDREHRLYEVLTFNEDLVKCRKGWTAVGRLHRWGNLHMFAGAVRLKPPKAPIQSLSRAHALVSRLLSPK